MDSPVKKIQVAKQRSDVYRGQFMAEIQLHWEQFVWIDKTGRTAKDHIRRFTCPEIHSACSKIKLVLVGAQTLKIENSVTLHRVDMNMITQLRFDYVRDVQTQLQSTV